MHPLLAHLDVSSGARGLILCVGLPLLPVVVHASSEGSDESVHMHNSHESSLFAGAVTKISETEPENTSEYHQEISQFQTKRKIHENKCKLSIRMRK